MTTHPDETIAPPDGPAPGDPIALATRFARPARGPLIVACALAVAAGVLEIVPYWLIYRSVQGLTSTCSAAPSSTTSRSDVRTRR